VGFYAGSSSPKRNRLDQCLLGSKQSQKWVFLGGDFEIKALIIKALVRFYAASQALMQQSDKAWCAYCDVEPTMRT
jgi:hypothetical protein